MDVTKYNIEFVYGKPYTVTCDEFMGGAKFPHIWVAPKITSGKKVVQFYFTFYKCPDELFWFELLPEDEQIAYGIAIVIGNKFSLRVEKRIGIQIEV